MRGVPGRHLGDGWEDDEPIGPESLDPDLWAAEAPAAGPPLSHDWTCGAHQDTTPSFAEVVRAAVCPGDKRGCARKVVVLFVAFDEAEGTHPIPPLTFTGTCARHRQKVGRMAAELSVGWLGVGEITPAQVPAILAWFHGRSGLCVGDRGLAVLSPRRPAPTR